MDLGVGICTSNMHTHAHMCAHTYAIIGIPKDFLMGQAFARNYHV